MVTLASPSDLSHLSVDWQNPINWNHALNRGRIAWWLNVPQFQGGTVFRDLVGLNDGTLTNMDPATDWVGPSRPGSFGALDFGGTDEYVALVSRPELRDLPTTHAFTITIVCKPDSVGNDLGVFAWNGTDVLVIYPNDNNSGSGGLRIFWSEVAAGNMIDENGADLSGIWQSITFVSRAANDHEAFRDAVSIGTSSASVNPAGPFTDVYMAQFPAQNFDGQIASVQIWSRALSDSELKQNFELSLQGYPGMLNRIRVTQYSEQVVAPAGGRIMGSIAGQGGLAGPGGLAGRRGGMAA